MDPSPNSAPRELKDTRAMSSSSLNSAVSSSSITNKPPTLSQRSPSVSISAGSTSGHRQSFAENLRNAPSSPRSQRHPSFTQAALQDLLNHPPAHNKHANPKFAGRDWRDVDIGELVSSEDIKWVEIDSSVEEATKVSLVSPLVYYICDVTLAVHVLGKLIEKHLVVIVNLGSNSCFSKARPTLS